MKSQYIMEKGCLVVYVPRELDHHQANRIRTETDLLIDTYHVRHLVFDFTETEFMDSSGIGVIIGRCKNLGYSGGDVSACHLTQEFHFLFRFMVTMNDRIRHRFGHGRLDIRNLV